ncbi:hypothetical protein RF55_16674 [Lasius niger]|uniref:Uncharacterized protein n=1 Tax=Lasius niger TaxID=67767 RepID=A0A0J7K412_LASNI|nr:hypothetical protein RF55_16674 [Lasius niger]
MRAEDTAEKREEKGEDKEGEEKKAGKMTERAGKGVITEGRREIESARRAMLEGRKGDRREEEGAGREEEEREGQEVRRKEEVGGKRGEGVMGYGERRGRGDMKRETEGRKMEKFGKEEGRAVKERREEDSWWKCVEEEEAEEEEGKKELWKKLEGRIEKERRKEEEREREKEVREKREEQVRKERRRRNLGWRRIEGDSFEERCRSLKMMLERVLERKVELRGVEERIGEGEKRMLLVIMEKEGDREVLEKREEIGRRWKMYVDEDLTRKERKMKWRIKKRARIEGKRKKGSF